MGGGPIIVRLQVIYKSVTATVRRIVHMRKLILRM